MALINYAECDREISDKAKACPGCGAPVSIDAGADNVRQSHAPSQVKYDSETASFNGTMALMVKLAMRAIQDIGWKLDQVNEELGLVTFQTGMSWGSWSGVSCSLMIQEASPGTFHVTGTGKQNLQGGQLVALDLFGEAKGKAQKAINKMKAMAAENN